MTKFTNCKPKNEGVQIMFRKKGNIDWSIVTPILREKTGKEYDKAYVRDVIKGRRPNKKLSPILREMKLI